MGFFQMKFWEKIWLSELEDGFNFRVEGDVRGGDSVDREFGASGFGKMEKTADVIVLVVTGEEALGFGARQTEDRNRDWLAKIVSVRAI